MVERAKLAVESVSITVISNTEEVKFAIYSKAYHFPSHNGCGRQRELLRHKLSKCPPVRLAFCQLLG